MVKILDRTKVRTTTVPLNDLVPVLDFEMFMDTIQVIQRYNLPTNNHSPLENWLQKSFGVVFEGFPMIYIPRFVRKIYEQQNNQRNSHFF